MPHVSRLSSAGHEDSCLIVLLHYILTYHVRAQLIGLEAISKFSVNTWKPILCLAHDVAVSAKGGRVSLRIFDSALLMLVSPSILRPGKMWAVAAMLESDFDMSLRYISIFEVMTSIGRRVPHCDFFATSAHEKRPTFRRVVLFSPVDLMQMASQLIIVQYYLLLCICTWAPHSLAESSFADASGAFSV